MLKVIDRRGQDVSRRQQRMNKYIVIRDMKDSHDLQRVYRTADGEWSRYQEDAVDFVAWDVAEIVAELEAKNCPGYRVYPAIDI